MSIFRFKQFQVDQTGCAMKVNTDGVLLGALAGAERPLKILDVGTGTGVVALMLAQRFPGAVVDAVELDHQAAITAQRNFEGSPFADRLTVYSTSYQDFLLTHPNKQYDLIVSNPPFYINSLASPHQTKTLAKHAGDGFFDELMAQLPKHLAAGGGIVMVLPIDTANMVDNLAKQQNLHLNQYLDISSYPQSAPHRKLLFWNHQPGEVLQRELTIYEEPRKYTAQYRTVLSSFLTIF